MVQPDSENFCLNWNDFIKNVTSSFRELRRNQEFTDVTLACGDGQRIEAHKMILASGSLVFQDLLRQSGDKAAHTLILERVFDPRPVVTPNPTNPHEGFEDFRLESDRGLSLPRRSECSSGKTR